MYNPKSLLADEFIDHQEILDTLAYADANKNNRELVESLLEKARPRRINGQLHCTDLTHREASVLLACEDPELTQKMFTLAEEIKKAFYGNRSDQRTLDEVIAWLMDMGFIPSFCTACYRAGRTGDRFMSLCKSGQIQNCCHPNALMTLKEYLVDYASDATRKQGDAMIASEIPTIPNEKVRNALAQYLERIEKGERDFRF